ncbi:MAG: type II toxin-antitoxin system RelE/ParE family toxin [Desulfatibacillaceae bacterium]|nr:type II toxin-antitoxin system RelE/ParE family toxin [Desulfatibacillaceae bacterium]
MAGYEIFFKQSVEKDIDAIPKRDLKKILAKVEGLAENPRPKGCEKLAGLEFYRIRKGIYRIVYLLEDKKLVVCVIKIGHRKDIYR